MRSPQQLKLFDDSTPAIAVGYNPQTAIDSYASRPGTMPLMGVADNLIEAALLGLPVRCPENLVALLLTEETNVQDAYREGR